MTIDELIKSSLKGKTTLSKDAVEVLMRLAFEAGAKQGRVRAASDAAEEERERQHGPMFM